MIVSMHTFYIFFSPPFFPFFLLRILFRGIGRWSSEIVSARSALVPAATLSAWPYKDLSFEKKKKRGRDSNLGWLGKHSEEKRERYVDPPAVRFHSLFPFSLLFTSIYIFSLLLVFFSSFLSSLVRFKSFMRHVPIDFQPIFTFVVNYSN